MGVKSRHSFQPILRADIRSSYMFCNLHGPSTLDGGSGPGKMLSYSNCLHKKPVLPQSKVYLR